MTNGILIALSVIAVLLALIGIILHGYSLTKQRKVKGKGDVVIMLFFTDWCKYCKEFKPTWNKLKARNSNVKFVEVDGDKQAELLKKYGVQSFPTVIKFVNGVEPENGEKYEANSGEDRTISKIEKFIYK